MAIIHPGQTARVCSRCKVEKDLNSFHRLTRRGRQEVQSRCKQCQAELDKKPPKLWRRETTVFSAATERERIWAAGVFEGEGTATINSSGKRGYTRGRVTMTNTDPELIGLFHHYWPGTIYLDKKKGNGRHAVRWTLDGVAAAEFAVELLPYVRSTRMRQRMELLIASQEMRRQGAKDPEYLKICNDYRLEMRALNLRGRGRVDDVLAAHQRGKLPALLDDGVLQVAVPRWATPHPGYVGH